MRSNQADRLFVVRALAQINVVTRHSFLQHAVCHRLLALLSRDRLVCKLLGLWFLGLFVLEETLLLFLLLAGRHIGKLWCLGVSHWWLPVATALEYLWLFWLQLVPLFLCPLLSLHILLKAFVRRWCCQTRRRLSIDIGSKPQLFRFFLFPFLVYCLLLCLQPYKQLILCSSYSAAFSLAILQSGQQRRPLCYLLFLGRLVSESTQRPSHLGWAWYESQ